MKWNSCVVACYHKPKEISAAQIKFQPIYLSCCPFACELMPTEDLVKNVIFCCTWALKTAMVTNYCVQTLMNLPRHSSLLDRKRPQFLQKHQCFCTKVLVFRPETCAAVWHYDNQHGLRAKAAAVSETMTPAGFETYVGSQSSSRSIGGPLFVTW